MRGSGFVVAPGALPAGEPRVCRQVNCGKRTGSHDMVAFHGIDMIRVRNRVLQHFRHRDMVQAASLTTAGRPSWNLIIIQSFFTRVSSVSST